MPEGEKIAPPTFEKAVNRSVRAVVTTNSGQVTSNSRCPVYVVGEEAGRVVGCARLLPTTRPYLLGEVCPQLLNGMPPPSSPEIWELSRFAALDFDEKRTSPLGQFSSPVAVELLQE